MLEADSDRSGFIDYNEFVAAMMKKKENLSREKLK
jgi:Ca2+-binding EF-hand superfamily protein